MGNHQSRFSRENLEAASIAWKAWRWKYNDNREGLYRDEYDMLVRYARERENPLADLLNGAAANPDVRAFPDSLGDFTEWAIGTLFPDGRLDRSVVWEACQDSTDEIGDPLPVPED